MINPPTISVILSVYNAEKYIAETVESVLNQTYSDFELIIIDDGSIDNSMNILRSYSDHRIQLFTQANAGQGATLKRGLGLAKGKYIARQDSDDVSFPTRFEKQIQFLEQHPEIALLGTWAQIIDENGNKENRYHQHPSNPDELKLDLVFNNPTVHSSIMFRKEITDEIGGYSTQRKSFEDFDLIARVSQHFPVSNLPEVLLYYREVSTGISKSNSKQYNLWVIDVCTKNIEFYWSDLSRKKRELIASAYHGEASFQEQFSDKEIENTIKILAEIVIPSTPSAIRKRYIDKHIFQFKRKFYNSKIESKENSPLCRLKYKIKRKILFFRFSKGNTL